MRFFHEKWDSAYSRRFGIQKKSTIANLMLMQNYHEFCDCSALYVACFKIVMTTTYFWPPIRFFAPHALKDHLTQLDKTLLISHYKWNIWSLCHKNHSITCSSSSGYLGVKWPIFACFADILSLPERIVAWSLLQSATHHGLARSIISSDLWMVFYSFSLCDNIHLESRSI